MSKTNAAEVDKLLQESDSDDSDNDADLQDYGGRDQFIDNLLN